MVQAIIWCDPAGPCMSSSIGPSHHMQWRVKLSEYAAFGSVTIYRIPQLKKEPTVRFEVCGGDSGSLEGTWCSLPSMSRQSLCLVIIDQIRHVCTVHGPNNTVHENKLSRYGAGPGETAVWLPIRIIIAQQLLYCWRAHHSLLYIAHLILGRLLL